MTWSQNAQLLTGVAAVIVAILGFTIGNLVKHRFDLRAERHRDQVKARAIAVSLRAEVLGLCRQIYVRQEVLKNSLLFRAGSDENNEKFRVEARSVITTDIYRSLIGQIGLLPYDIVADIAEFYTAVPEFLEILESLGGMSVNVKNISLLTNELDRVYGTTVRLAASLGDKLSDFAGIPRPARIVSEQEPLAQRATRAAEKIASYGKYFGE